MQIDIANRQELHPLHISDVRGFITSVLDDLGMDAELSVAFVDDRTIAGLNNSFLGEDCPTDVLAFPLEDDDDSGNNTICGEIIVSVETAISVSDGLGCNIDCEIYLYLVHGLLHLAGYDDKVAASANDMHNKEKQILARHGYKVEID